MKDSVQNWIEFKLNTADFSAEIQDALKAIIADEFGGIEEGTGDSTVLGYAQATDGGRSLISLVKTELNHIAQVNNLDANQLWDNIETSVIQNVDWATNWKEFYTPQRAGKNFIIFPSWERPKDIQPEDILIQLDPGQAFGTGQHESTKLCLEMLEQVGIADKRVADIGCGSGILSVAAAKLGAAHIEACDIDTLAIEATHTNIAINQTEERITVTEGSAADIESSAPFDIVISNIIAETLLNISDGLISLAAVNGRLLWSGIVRERTEKVENFFIEKKLKIENKLSLGEWFCYLVKV